ncbi:NAD-dependent epimerase/dehydratase family protein, partial [Magnetococcales bacterium HHB-1]
LKKKRTDKKSIDFTIQGTGEETRAFIHINDFTDGLILMMEKGEHLNIYNIGNDQETKISELAHLAAAQCKMKIQIQPGALQKGGTPRRCPSIDKMRQLGFNPSTSLKEGLALTIPWYLDHAKLAPERT